MQPQTRQARIQRLFKKRRKQAERLGERAEDQLERNLVRKLGRLYLVRRFVLVWMGLAIAMVGCSVIQTRALSGYYQELQPVSGGIYREGIVGSYTNANPLYATGQVNDSVSKLIFSGLLKYDQHNNLTGDLAASYEVNESGTIYTVHLRPGLIWHDGKPLTSADAVFTYQLIQNPDAQSPLNASWRSVAVSAPDDHTVVFTLPNPLSSFPHSLVNGIVPKHILEGVALSNLRSVSFSTTEAVGSGPYRLKGVEVAGSSPATRYEEIELVPFSNYYAGTPAIANFSIRTYPDNGKLIAGFRDKEVNAMVGVHDVPDDIAKDSSMRVTTMPLTAANMVFFKTTDGVTADKAVRQALVGGADTASLLDGLPKPVLPVREPILPSTPGFDPSLQQLQFDTQKANEILDAAGWTRQANGVRSKDGKPLQFRLYAQDTTDFQQVTTKLQVRWRELGARVDVFLQPDIDLRATVASHSYDAVLYGISLGVDPDGFVYWHSSQADVRSATRLNLSEWQSAIADSALEAGRTRSDVTLRTVKYRPFLEAWRTEAPALGLYQPLFLYVSRGPVYGLEDRPVTTDTDRFNNVEQWKVRRVLQPVDTNQVNE